MVDAISDHPGRAIVKRILELEDSPSFSEPVATSNDSYVQAKEKVFGQMRHLDRLFEKSLPLLASVYGLNALQGYLQNVFNEMTAFVTNRNPGHIINALTHVEQNVIPTLWAFGPAVESLGKSGIGKLFATQGEASKRIIEELTKRHDGLVERVAELTAAIDAQKEKFEALTAGFSKERAEAAAAVAKLDQQFAKDETSRLAAFEAAVSKMKEQFLEFAGNSANKSSNLIAELQDLRDDAANIVQVVGNIGVTGNYKIIADSEGRSANFWRWATVGIFGVAIAVAVATFYRFWHEPVNAENTFSIAIRLLYALVLTGPAFYTARESARHRSNADSARQRELELASVGPFIELMPEEKKVQIRETLAAAYFGKESKPHIVDSPVDIPGLKDLVVEAIKAARK